VLDVLISLALLVVALFALVIFVGAPYLPTLNPQAEAALDMLDLKPGQTLLELGCGDGKLLILAAERGLNVVGVELNPILALISYVRTRKYRSQVRVICANFWKLTWPKSDGVFVFLLDKFMPKLDQRMLTQGGRLASVAFAVPRRKPLKEHAGVFLYDYTSSPRRK
jgi:protein-L-isoaspartate O-methyltransferase